MRNIFSFRWTKFTAESYDGSILTSVDSSSPALLVVVSRFPLTSNSMTSYPFSRLFHKILWGSLISAYIVALEVLGFLTLLIVWAVSSPDYETGCNILLLRIGLLSDSLCSSLWAVLEKYPLSIFWAILVIALALASILESYSLMTFLILCYVSPLKTPAL